MRKLIVIGLAVVAASFAPVASADNQQYAECVEVSLSHVPYWDWTDTVIDNVDAICSWWLDHNQQAPGGGPVIA